eukprot:gene17267-18992_t
MSSLKNLLKRGRFPSENVLRSVLALLFRTYRLPEDVMTFPRTLVLSGPSGSGKSTLIKRLMSEYPNRFGFSVSHTSRKPRPGEVDGKDYHYSTKEEMMKAIEAGEFIEHAEFSHNLYGTSKKSVQNVFSQGQICILDIDRQGVQSVKETDLDCLMMFIKPPSFEVLEQRLRGRGTEKEEVIEKRLQTSREEFAYAELPGSYDYILVNDDLERAYQEFKSIVSKEILDLS